LQKQIFQVGYRSIGARDVFPRGQRIVGENTETTAVENDRAKGGLQGFIEFTDNLAQRHQCVLFGQDVVES
jgi:hypothetical protein